MALPAWIKANLGTTTPEVRTTTHGSILAVLDDGTHICAGKRFDCYDDFAYFVRLHVGPVRRRVRRLTYAFGKENETYCGAEVREVFFGEGA